MFQLPRAVPQQQLELEELQSQELPLVSRHCPCSFGMSLLMNVIILQLTHHLPLLCDTA